MPIFKSISVSLVALLIASPLTAKAVELDDVLARLEKLEAENRAAAAENKKIASENKKIISENAVLRDRVNRLEAKGPTVSANKVRSGNKQQQFASLNQDNIKSFKETYLNPVSQEVLGNSKDIAAENAWDGLYGGLNVGYGLGLSNNANTLSRPLQDATNNAPSNNLSGSAFATVYNPTLLGITALVNSGTAKLNQYGVVGGAQVGYNWTLYPTYIAGFETDIQASAISGRGQYLGNPVNQFYQYNLVFPGMDVINISTNSSYIGSGTVSSSIGWLGTARVKLGYIISPSLYFYGTGGLAYGQLSANSKNYYMGNTINNSYVTSGIPLGSSNTYSNVFQSTGGDGYSQQIKAGFTAGAGIEWMFRRNFSVKAETLYYNLGYLSFAAGGVGQTGLITNIPITKVYYDGVIARMGVNYHFNSVSEPERLKF